MSQGIGQPVRRKEDRRLLTGRGIYSDDVNLDGQAYACFLRASVSHAYIESIDTEAAKAAPGVLAVLTAEDFKADGLIGIPHNAIPIDAIDHTKPAFVNLDGSAAFDAPHMPLAGGKVRHVGEAVAMAIAETEAQARDAAELIRVSYNPLNAATTAPEAAAETAPLLWEGAPGNSVVDAELGDKQATDAAFDTAAHVVSATLINQRIVNAQIEPRAAVAEFNPETGVYTLHAGCQGAHRLKNCLIGMLQIPPEKIRVIARDVGGGFGPRNFLDAEFALVTWATKHVARPVKWQGDRSESFLGDVQARDLVAHAELALDADGKFLAFRSELLGNVGGNPISYVPLSNGPRLATSLYDVGAGHVRIKGFLTNTLPTGPYRGAGRPEAMYHIERLIDLAAAETGIDRIELRRRNLIGEDAFPYKSPMGMTYDVGAFERNMDITLDLADWAGFDRRRADSEARGRLRGIGLANYIEAPVGAPIEYARVAVRPDESVEVQVGTHSHGQGHETSFAQVISDWLGVPFDAVTLVFGDTDEVPKGGGTHSDRSMRMAGRVMVDASEKVIEQGKNAAAQLLEAATADIEFKAGRFTVAGTDRTVGIFDVARALATSDLPREFGAALDADAEFVGRMPAYPNGCAVCEVEIDPETGALEIARYSSTDDAGRVINPMIVHGQTHGGIAMGVGQALMERCVYDPESGQILTGSFMDYCVPRADDLPSFAVELNEVPTPGNPLGVKGGGEGGTTPALAAAINAVVDALKPYGVRHIDMPATPHRIWQAISAAGG